MEKTRYLNEVKEKLKKEIVGEVLDMIRAELEEDFTQDFISGAKSEGR